MKNEKVILLFAAQGCPVCEKVKAKLRNHGLPNHHLYILDANAEENLEYVDKHMGSIQDLPHIKVYEDNKLVKSHTGDFDPKDILD